MLKEKETFVKEALYKFSYALTLQSWFFLSISFHTHLPYNRGFVVVEMGADGREHPRPQPQGIDVQNQCIHPGLKKTQNNIKLEQSKKEN